MSDDRYKPLNVASPPRRSPMGDVLAGLLATKEDPNAPLKAMIVTRLDDAQVQTIPTPQGEGLIPITGKIRFDAIDVKETAHDTWGLLIATKDPKGGAMVHTRVWIAGGDIALVRVVSPVLASGGT